MKPVIRAYARFVQFFTVSCWSYAALRGTAAPSAGSLTCYEVSMWDILKI